MDSVTARDAIIEKQKEELARYKKRFTDLVSAYKSLIKEKEVLEASLKVLNQENISSDQASDDSTEKSGDESQSNADSKSEDSDQLKVQLNTLMKSLSTLSEEKSKMEAGFQADKKVLRSEKQQLELKIKELQERLEQETKSHLEEMEDFKARLIVERHQREKEHNDHGMMIRELQKVVAEERSKREHVESEALSNKSRLSETEAKLYAAEKSLAEAKDSLEAANNAIEVSKRGSGDLVNKLNSQLASLKNEFSNLTLKERMRADEEIERASSLTKIYEERIVNLESRLAELSDIVGSYDRIRQTNQIEIDRLQEKVAHLELERNEEKGDLNVDNLLSRLKNLKELLELANISSEKPIDVKDAVACIFDIGKELDVHEICHVKYEELRKQYDALKNSMSNINCSYRSGPNYEIENLNGTITSLKEKIRKLHEQIDIMQTEYKREIESIRQNFICERSKLKDRLQETQKQWSEEVEVLEAQLSKQRERALVLIKEKDKDLLELKKSFFPPRLSQDMEDGHLIGGSMLHFNQEVARKDVELSRLRKEVHNLQGEIRDLFIKYEESIKRGEQLNQALTEQNERLVRCQSQDGADLEYLKNVIYRFLTSTDFNCQTHMLNAIITVLKFSDNEKSCIIKMNRNLEKSHSLSVV